MVDEIQRKRQWEAPLARIENPGSNVLDNYYGWNSSMGRDLRYDPPLPHQFQYRDQGRTVVSGNEPAFTDMGRNRNVPFPQSTGTPNFRPPYGAPGQPSYDQWRQQIDPTGMGGGLGSLSGMGEGIGSLQEQAAVDPSDWRTILRILEAGGDPGTETQTTELWQTWQKIKDRIGEDAANDWLASQQPAYANRGGLMSLRR